ncbi:ArsR family transcriptional regulator [Paenibacillus pasadenensis]|uniref:ArsR/SmtB family transcription factor n=1 Tax=Paenibacillus pasadenensis TaxID=217090 RepID=UPI00203A6DC6|nr:helix-turn-helix transcriptional regulator [Paenibacillus pasadenensis]MCM3749932.1 ArsR family transcriptional regulator [Paenibacillus pasadenensis]
MSTNQLSNDEVMAILKTLSNETRLNILNWLNNPEECFGKMPDQVRADFPYGVCVGQIKDKSGLTQSVISSYLASMQKAGLLESRRFGQWTYYRRNEPVIAAFIVAMAAELKPVESANP